MTSDAHSDPDSDSGHSSDAEADAGHDGDENAVSGADSDRRTQIHEAFPELEDIGDSTLRTQVVDAWERGLERGGWRAIRDIPYAWNIHEVSNVEHVRGTTRIALESAAIQREFHGAAPDEDVLVAACLLHDVGKCYEYVEFVDAALVDPDQTYCSEEIPHSISGYALAHEVGCPLAVQRAIPHFLGEVPTRTLEAELVKSANSASSNAITQATMGITLAEWVERYSQTSG